MRLYGDHNLPFVVLKQTAFKFDLAAFRERASRENLKANGWDLVQKAHCDIPISEALAAWDNDLLKVNFVDSPLPMREEDLDTSQVQQFGVRPDNTMFILSNNKAYTPFHQDPVRAKVVSGEIHWPWWHGGGGGYMVLGQGKKLWHLIPNSLTHVVYDENAKCMINLPMDQLLYKDNHALWGKITQAWIEAGDFLYFPPGMIHRVYTYERSIGWGGYISLPTDEANIKGLLLFYEKHGLNPADGIGWTKYHQFKIGQMKNMRRRKCEGKN